MILRINSRATENTAFQHVRKNNIGTCKAFSVEPKYIRKAVISTTAHAIFIHRMPNKKTD